MENNLELSPKYIGKFSQDFVKVCDTLKEASYHIRKKGFSKYPIFVLSKEIVPFGSLLVSEKQFGNEWNYQASYLEIFTEKKLVSDEGFELFKENYKDADEFCCLFVIDADFTSFIFLPYPEDEA